MFMDKEQNHGTHSVIVQSDSKIIGVCTEETQCTQTSETKDDCDTDDCCEDSKERVVKVLGPSTVLVTPKDSSGVNTKSYFKTSILNTLGYFPLPWVPKTYHVHFFC